MWPTIAPCDRESRNIKTPKVAASRALCASVLAAPAKAPPITKASPPARTGVSLFSGLKAVLAVHGTVASGLERHSGLLSASGADYSRTP